MTHARPWHPWGSAASLVVLGHILVVAYLARHLWIDSSTAAAQGTPAPAVVAQWVAAPSQVAEQVQQTEIPPSEAPSEPPPETSSAQEVAEPPSAAANTVAEVLPKPTLKARPSLDPTDLSSEKQEPKPATQPDPEVREKEPTERPVDQALAGSRASKSAATTAHQLQSRSHSEAQSQDRLADERANWQGRLASHLERHKRYPHQAKSRREQGRVVVKFVLNAQGEVVTAQLNESSGSFLLDREVRSLIRRAQPLPPPPQGLSSAKIEVVVPVVFALR